MHLEELQQQWQRLEERLDRSLALESELVRQVVLQPARRRLNRLAIWPVIDLLFCVVGLIGVGGFLGDHFSDWRQSLPALVVQGGLVALLVASVWQLQRISELDWTGPVSELQGRLDRLRVTRIRQFQWVALLSPLMGFCGLLVGVQWLMERATGRPAGIVPLLDAGWVIANLVLGILWIPVGYLAARYLAGRFRGHSWWTRLLDGVAGETLKGAQADVNRWADLQQASPGAGD